MESVGINWLREVDPASDGPGQRTLDAFQNESLAEIQQNPGGMTLFRLTKRSHATSPPAPRMISC